MSEREVKMKRRGGKRGKWERENGKGKGRKKMNLK